MRIVTSLVFAALIAASSVLAMPTSAHAWDNFIIFMTKRVCASYPSTFKNGCFGYIESRTLYCMSEGPSLAKCKKYCDDWYDYNAGAKAKCYEGCEFVRAQD